MTSKVNLKKLHTTLGELIVAIMDEALGITGDERSAYRLTDLVLNRRLLPVPVVAAHRTTKISRQARFRY